MISQSEIIKRIRISDLGSANKSYANEIIEKYKIAAKTRLKHPTKTQKWTIDNQRQVVDVNDKSIIIAGRGSAYFDEIEFMIQTEAKVEGMLGSVYPTSSRSLRSRKTFWERVNTSIEGNPNFSKYNKQQLIQNEIITFNEQSNSGDFNYTPITDINVSDGCSECTKTEINDSVEKEGYHKMPDGSMMKDSDMEPLNNNMKMAGIVAAGIIGLLLYTRSVKN